MLFDSYILFFSLILSLYYSLQSYFIVLLYSFFLFNRPIFSFRFSLLIFLPFRVLMSSTAAICFLIALYQLIFFSFFPKRKDSSEIPHLVLFPACQPIDLISKKKKRDVPWSTGAIEDIYYIFPSTTEIFLYVKKFLHSFHCQNNKSIYNWITLL